MRPWIAFALFLFAAQSSMAGPAPWNANAQGVVLNGYDVVAYFSQDLAVQGSATLAASYDGKTFYFSTAEHRDAFKASPQKYLPAYGGYCAFGVAANHATVPADPRTFKIYNGRLLLFYNDLYQGQPVNTKVLWNADEEKMYKEAKAHWAELLKKD